MQRGLTREERRRSAELLAAYMRGEITSSEYLDKLPKDWVFSDDDGRPTAEARVRNVEPLEHNPAEWVDLKAEEHRVAATPEIWERMRRELAFLESDLVVEERELGRRAPYGARAVAVFIGASALLATVSLLVLPLAWALATAWFGIGLVGYGVRAVCWRWPALVGGSPPGTQERPFEPFNNEEQWRAHEHRVEPFQIPAYDAARLNRRVPRRKVGLWQNALGVLICVPVVAIMLVFAALTLPFQAAAGFWLVRQYQLEAKQRIADSDVRGADCGVSE